MDASDGDNHKGNGSVPLPVSQPSVSPAGGHGQSPEPLVVVEATPAKPKKLKPKQRAMLAAIAKTANITHAARLAKVGRETHYDWLAVSPEYARAVESAMEEACDLLEQEARRRATQGTKEPVFYLGEEVGYVRKYSDALLIFLLKAARPAKFRDRYEITGAGGKALHPERVTVDVKVAYYEALKTLTDEELESHNAIAAKLLARSTGQTSPGAN